jgi:hypothetical protein
VRELRGERKALLEMGAKSARRARSRKVDDDELLLEVERGRLSVSRDAEH